MLRFLDFIVQTIVPVILVYGGKLFKRIVQESVQDIRDDVHAIGTRVASLESRQDDVIHVVEEKTQEILDMSDAL